MELGGVVVVPELASWYVAGGGFGFDVEAGVPGLSVGSDFGISLGGGGMQLDVKSRRQADNVSYRMTFIYGEIEAGIGGSLFGAVSLSAGAPELPAGGTPVMRNVGSPSDSGADGPPTGFLGPAFTTTGNAGIGNTVAGGLIAMGPPPMWTFATGAMTLALFKYYALFGGFGLSGSAAAGVAFQPGVIVQIDKYVDGRATNQRVSRNGLVNGTPFPAPW
jgi:hypothetical protein